MSLEGYLIIDWVELEKRLDGYKLVDPKVRDLMAAYVYEALLKDFVGEAIKGAESQDTAGVCIKNFNMIWKSRWAPYIYAIASALDLVLDKAIQLGKPVVASNTDVLKLPQDLQARIQKVVD